MSDAANTIARKPAARKTSNGGNARFDEAEGRVRYNNRPSLEMIERLTPTEGQVRAMWRDFDSAPTFDIDELIGQGKTMIEDQVNLFSTILVNEDHYGVNDTALQLHLNRLIEGIIASAYGAATYCDKQVCIAKDAADPFYNRFRDEDRQGVDGGPNRKENLRRYAAIASVRAFALYQQAVGACAAYKELIGKDWTPYAGKNRRSLAERAEAQSVSDCGF